MAEANADAIFLDRLEQLQGRMHGAGVDAALIAPSSDLRYLTGLSDHITERLTLLLLQPQGRARLLAPAFEAPRLERHASLFDVETWRETDDPYRVLSALLAPQGPSVVAVSDTLWSRFLLGLQRTLASVRFVPASQLLEGMRMCKRPEEIELQRLVNVQADAAFAELVGRRLSGLGERELSRQLADLLLEAGSEAVGFATVAGGAHSASPHHTMTDRKIQVGDALLFDFGGRHQGYYADVTRTVVVGRPPEGFEAVYRVVRRAQEAAVAAVRPGVSAASIDAAAREPITQAGYGAHFSHRVGHGLGLDVHEAPYLTADNPLPLEPGMTFSVEPGIYLPGRFGVRIEDTVLVTDKGGERLNHCSRDLLVVA